MMLREFPRRDDLAPIIAARSRASYCKGESENVYVPALFNVCRCCSFRPDRSGIGFRGPIDEYYGEDAARTSCCNRAFGMFRSPVRFQQRQTTIPAGNSAGAIIPGGLDL